MLQFQGTSRHFNFKALDWLFLSDPCRRNCELPEKMAFARPDTVTRPSRARARMRSKNNIGPEGGLAIAAAVEGLSRLTSLNAS